MLQVEPNVGKFIVVWSILFLEVNIEHCILDFYQLDFKNDLPARKLPTHTLLHIFQWNIASYPVD